MDEFVEVAGFTGYKINRNGDCIGKHGRILKRGLTEKGYEQYNLFSDGKAITKYIHRLVALEFIENPNNLSDIDHIDNNKRNNNVTNLRWLSHADNCNRQDQIVNGKCYICNKTGFQTRYVIETKRHSKYFKHEDDAQFYIALLKVLYPRNNVD